MSLLPVEKTKDTDSRNRCGDRSHPCPELRNKPLKFCKPLKQQDLQDPGPDQALGLALAWKNPGRGQGVRGSPLEERLEGKDFRRDGGRGSARLGSRAPLESAREQTATH